ncbi:hypothetical protein [Zunongwangia sp.]|uniref:hypothetical protein n=1 Tax=Zunongwangia sp. TaxID=1965325 RepID=UPI003AA834B3
MNFKNIFSFLAIVSVFFVSCKENKKNEANPEIESNQQTIERKTKNKDSLTKNEETDTLTENAQYICYTSDSNKSKRIWIEFDDKSRAKKIKYEGQNKTIALKFKKEEYSEGGAHPTITSYYDEIYNGKVNGKYKLIHSGVWDYVTYIRGKDGKVFKYTIDHDEDPYGDKPCF